MLDGYEQKFIAGLKKLYTYITQFSASSFNRRRLYFIIMKFIKNKPYLHDLLLDKKAEEINQPQSFSEYLSYF